MTKLIKLLGRTSELKQWKAVLKTLQREFSQLGADQLVVRFKRKNEISYIRISSSSYDEVSFIDTSSHEQITVLLKNQTEISFIPSQKLNLTSNEKELLHGILKTISSRCETIPKVTRVSQTAWEKVRNLKPNSQIVATSQSMKECVEQAKLVAKFHTSVFISGESGCGKELLADLIHQLSPRANKIFLKINCAVLPHQLIESQLFGHERGSFTGATEQKQGYFERAQGGTIFLDEIAELDISLQAKLLRVLETGEYERLGGSKTLKADVRIISASHKNLTKAIQDGQFREDLFYRLHTFPINISPLRQRKEDIIPLTKHILTELCEFHKITYDGFSNNFEASILSYPWPGNGRELRNELEKALILCQGKELKFDRFEQETNSSLLSFAEETKKIITRALKQCGGKVQGKGSASEILDLKPQTLYSKIRKYNISL